MFLQLGGLASNHAASLLLPFRYIIAELNTYYVIHIKTSKTYPLRPLRKLEYLL